MVKLWHMKLPVTFPKVDSAFPFARWRW